MKNTKKHVIFDFDGTLLDTDGIILDSWQSVFRRYRGREEDEAVLFATFGETIRDTMKRFFPEVDQEEAVAHYRAYQEANCAGRVTLFEGTVPLLHELREKGYTTSIVTSRTGKTAHAYLEELGIATLFDVVVTCDDTPVHKPDPEPLRIALRKLGAEEGEAIMLGDTRFDIGCCNRAGVDSVLVRWGHTADEAAFEGFVPTHRIDRPAQLMEILGER